MGGQFGVLQNHPTTVSPSSCFVKLVLGLGWSRTSWLTVLLNRQTPSFRFDRELALNLSSDLSANECQNIQYKP